MEKSKLEAICKLLPHISPHKRDFWDELREEGPSNTPSPRTPAAKRRRRVRMPAVSDYVYASIRTFLGMYPCDPFRPASRQYSHVPGHVPVTSPVPSRSLLPRRGADMCECVLCQATATEGYSEMIGYGGRPYIKVVWKVTMKSYVYLCLNT